MENAIAVFGRNWQAAEFALQELLGRLERGGPVAVVDAYGRGAELLHGHDTGLDQREDVRWYDLANRRRPVSLFQFEAHDGLEPVLDRFLRGLGRVLEYGLTNEALDVAREQWLELSEHGRAGLGALLKTLKDLDTRWDLFDSVEQPDGYGDLLEMLGFALRFPAVYSLSEASNSERLALGNGHELVWFEALAEHFEPSEHRTLLWMLDVLLQDACIRCAGTSETQRNEEAPTLVHLFSRPKLESGIAPWVRQTDGRVRHLAVFAFEGRKPLSDTARAWAESAGHIAVAGLVDGVDRDVHGTWLSDGEAQSIESLSAGEVWRRDNALRRKTVVSLDRDSPGRHFEMFQIRVSGGRELSPVRQAAAVFSEKESPVQDGLYRKLCNLQRLRMGWERVKRGNPHSNGADEVTVADFAENADGRLANLQEELVSRTYRCLPLVRIDVPKEDSESRPLGICAVRDRVVMTAALDLLEPLFEPQFSQYSFAFRPRRNARQAVQLAKSFVEEGYTWVIKSDIRKCFESLDHGRLRRVLRRYIQDGDMLSLLDQWIAPEVLQFETLFPTVEGVEQGMPVAPLMANLYLHALDRFLESADVKFLRYADDILILAESECEAREALDETQDFLQTQLKLAFHPEKTELKAAGEGIGYLGFVLYPTKLKIQRTRIERTVQKVRRWFVHIANHKSSIMARAKTMYRLDGLIRGFRNYFYIDGEPEILEGLSELDERIEKMALKVLPYDTLCDASWQGREQFNPSVPLGEMNESSGPYSGWDSDKAINPKSVSPPGGARSTAGRSSGATEKGASAPQSVDEGKPGPEEDDLPDHELFLEEDGRLFVLKNGAFLTLRRDKAVVCYKGREVAEFEPASIQLVFVHGFGITITASLQLRLAELDVPLVIAPHGKRVPAVSSSLESPKSDLRRLQALRRDDDDVRKLARDIVSAKLANQASVLRYFEKYRRSSAPEVARKLKRAATEIRGAESDVKELPLDTEKFRTVLMGHEGRAAAVYWDAFGELAPEEYEFAGRLGKGADDPINSCLNFIYALLYAEVWRAVAGAGLDPYFGILHGSSRDNGSLVFDLIEEFRAPFADRVLLAMFGRGFEPKFREDGSIRTATCNKLVEGFRRRWTKTTSFRTSDETPKEILRQQVIDFARFVQKAGAYRPFRMKW